MQLESSSDSIEVASHMSRKRKLDCFTMDADTARPAAKRARFDAISINVTIQMGNISKHVKVDNISPDWSIEKLSNAICAIEHLNTNSTVIVFPMQFSSATETLRLCGIRNGCHLQIGLKFKNSQALLQYASSIEDFIVFVTTLTGKCIWVLCNETDTVADLKGHIKQCEGIPFQQQQLMLNGHFLNESKSLTDYNIKRLDRISLILKLRGV